MVMHPAGYLRGVRELTRQYDVLLIADEVAVGFGRTGRMFACEHEQVAPDSALPGQGSDRRLPAPGRHAGQRGDLAGLPGRRMPRAGPSSTATPTAAIRWGRPWRWPRSRSSRRNRPWRGCRRRSIAWPGTCGGSPRCRTVGHVRQCGLIAGIELVRDRRTKEPYPWEERRGHARLRLGPPRGRVAAAAGQRGGDLAAAGDLDGPARSHRAGRRARHRGGHGLSAGAAIFVRCYVPPTAQVGGNYRRASRRPSPFFAVFPLPVHLRGRLAALRRAADRRVLQQRPAGRGKAQTIQLLFEAAEGGKPVGIGPDGDRGMLRGMFGRGPAQLRVLPATRRRRSLPNPRRWESACILSIRRSSPYRDVPGLPPE